jgi:hypothetical protein
MLPVGDSLDLIGLISHEKITPDTRITTMAACRSLQIMQTNKVRAHTVAKLLYVHAGFLYN